MMMKHTTVILIILFVSLHCGRGIKDILDFNSAAAEPVQVDLQVPYANNSSFGSYITNSSGLYSSADTACPSGTAGHYTQCINSGIMRSVDLTGENSCTGLSASDSLGVFTWQCETSMGYARMVSTGYQPQSGLSGLIDFSSADWRNNSVSVFKDGEKAYFTSEGQWFDNTISSANAGGSLSGANQEVYILTADPAAAITLDSSNISLVSQPGLTITGPAASGQVVTSDNAFNYIEVSVDASSDNNGVYIASGGNFNIIRNSTVKNAQQHGIFIESNATRVEEVYTDGNAQAGASFANLAVGSSASNTSINGVVAARSGYRGVILDGTSTLANSLTVFQSANDGIQLVGNQCTVSSATSFNNAEHGLVIDNTAPDAIAVNNTAINNGRNGFHVFSSSHNSILVNSLSVNNGEKGIEIANSNNLTFYNTIISNPNGNGIEAGGSTGSSLYGFLKVANVGGTACVINSGTPGYDAACNITSGSGTVVTSGISVTSTFTGKVSSDSTNTTAGVGSSGTFTIGSVTDWVKFDNRFRGWGNTGGTFPDSGNFDRCTTNCQLWDHTLRAGDTGEGGSAVALNILSAHLAGNAADIINHTLTSPGATKLLRNSSEIMFDYIGNDNGLCENNEACLYTPNVGSYQGHGAINSSGSFTDGTDISGVSLSQYSNNGF